jgi:tetratricopeptide (TPR) repeat protein
VEAQAELGAVYAKTGQPVLALELFQDALAAEPNWALLQSNAAVVLLMLNRSAEAENAARRAVRLDAASVEANYILGIAMLMQGRTTAEAAKYRPSPPPVIPRRGHC